jgi:hypothetical protein
MVSKKRSQLPKTIWAYAYHIIPPQIAGRLRTIKTLLDHEHADAQGGGQTWVGRMVLEQQITHILVVSDSPEQSCEANRRLEAALKELKVEFSIGAPMVVADDAGPLPLT